MSRAYIGLGTNLGNLKANLESAFNALNRMPQTRLLHRSAEMSNKAYGVTDQPDFLNAVAELETGLAPLELLNRLKTAETALGRVPTYRWGPRIIDLDLLLYDNLILDDPRLTLPHADLHNRDFVLIPLAELAPDLIHPLLGKTMAELRDALSRR